MTAALQAEQERTIASLMAEQEDLEKQLNNVSDDDLLLLGGDDGSELEESELSVGEDFHSENELRFCIFSDNENFELFHVVTRRSR